VTVDTDRITDWASFHDVFSEALGFPPFYGRSLDAWRDCMDYPDEDDGMKAVVAQADDPIVIKLVHAPSFKSRCPHQWHGIVEAVASLNLERVDAGKIPLLVLAFEPAPPPYVGYGAVDSPEEGGPTLEPGWGVR
jgi:RNAse (barnase) inhibitor barstar